MHSIRMLDGIDAANGAPVGNPKASQSGTTGMLVPKDWAGMRAHLQIAAEAASGTRSYELIVWVYRKNLVTVAHGSQVQGTGQWFRAHLTGLISGGTADFYDAILLEGILDWDGIYIEQVGTPGGTTPVLTVSLGLAQLKHDLARL